MKKHIYMVAYTEYSTDARVRREAETLAALPEYLVTVLVLKESTVPGSYELGEVRIQELNLGKYRGKSNASYLLSYFKFLLLAFLEIGRALFKRSLDIVHIHNMPNFLLFSAILPYLVGKKLVLDIHDTMLETYAVKFADGNRPGFLLPLLRIEESICCSLAHKIICVNDIQREALLGRGIDKGKTVISMNLPDPGLFHNSNNGAFPVKEDTGFKLIYHGTVSKRLGVDLAIHAVSRLAGRIPGLELHIVGAGDDLEEFAELSRRLGIQELVHFRGKKRLDEIVQMLRGMDMGIIPNDRNVCTELMLPVKMMECIAVGIPVVVPRLRTIEYYFSDDTVTYYEPGNIESLADAILTLYADTEQRKQKADQAKRFLDERGWEKQKSSLINLYKDLL